MLMLKSLLDAYVDILSDAHETIFQIYAQFILLRGAKLLWKYSYNTGMCTLVSRLKVELMTSLMGLVLLFN